jgi:DNA-binding transcriptional MocR family regulator
MDRGAGGIATLDISGGLEVIALLLLFMQDDSTTRGERVTLGERDAGGEHPAGGERGVERELRRATSTSPSGARLPSTRSLVARHAVSPLTVQRVIQRLVAEGLLETRAGAGTFVAVRRRARRADHSWQTTALGAARSETFDVGSALAPTPVGVTALHYGYPMADLLPGRLVRAAIARAARSPLGLDRAPVAGLPELRAWFAADAAGANREAPAHPDDVVIMPGGQSALSSIFRALAAPGDAIVMESPTYWGAIEAARQAGLRIVPVARGASAPSIDEVDAAFGSSGAKLFYAQPHFANPTGALWSAADKRGMLGVVRAHGAYLVEDDWAHDFGIDSDVTSLFGDDPDGHVVYVRSLTKSVAPSLRVGAAIARGPARQRIQADRTVDDLYVSGLLQVAALDVLTNPGWPSHLRFLRGELRLRRDELAREVVRHLGAEALTAVPRGGLNLWLSLPERTDVAALAIRSRDAGVMIAPGNVWFPTEAPGPFVRLNYTGAPPEQFAPALETLAALLR